MSTIPVVPSTAAAPTRKIVAITAGLSQPSSTRLLTDRLVADSVGSLATRGVTADVHVVELRDLAHEIMDMMLTGFPAPRLRTVIDAVGSADGIIAVSPIFTASYSGLFKSFFDILDNAAIAGVPVLMAATAGTPRHSLTLEHEMRPMFSYLRAIVTPTAVFAASSDWGTGGSTNASTDDLAGRIRRAAQEFSALVSAHEQAPAPMSPFGDFLPFAQQLAGK
ncbi:FMN reductase [Sanguibacter gelidistatuariae]|uniref:FMN reductase n=1 Tax=Sanguibacter gelidistatuariae TaxID=1814289 RepID=A0A1G6JB82_9MICO|nr:FMN reductase [Sanguibacter gelidistatuariae]SDC16044.1 FMN reductase [Sanguibacter gelidistatuariae]